MGATDARRYYGVNGDHSVVHLGEPIQLGSVLIPRAHLVTVTSLEHERWKWAHPRFCRRMGIE